MAMLKVRTRPGRRAFYEGRVIPHDKYIEVADTAYVRRLINYHGDIEVEGGEEVTPTLTPAPERKAN